jgi:hypothetical protein
MIYIYKFFHDSALLMVSSIQPVEIEQHSCVDTIYASYLGDPRFKHRLGDNQGFFLWLSLVPAGKFQDSTSI